jgi:hypothetical protein
VKSEILKVMKMSIMVSWTQVTLKMEAIHSSEPMATISTSLYDITTRKTTIENSEGALK